MRNKRKRVGHFVRKLLPPTASFIKNQITAHINYVPVVVYKEYVESPFAREIKSSCRNLFLDNRKIHIEKKYSDFLYRKFRRITKGDVAKILSYLRNDNAKILHFHYGTDAGMYLDIIRYSKLPSVVSFYGYDCSSFPKWYFGYGRYYLSRVFRHVNYVLAMSEDMKNGLIDLGCPDEKIIVHYYGTDVAQFFYKRKYNEKGGANLLIVSSLDEKKGHLNVFKALEKTRQGNKIKIRFRVVGDGPLEKKLKQYVKQHNLNEIVTFVGPLKYLSKEFLQEFYNADIFMHPSIVASNGDKEGIPGTIVEAMATGLPVISTYHAGIPYVVRHMETGLLVNEWDINTLVEYICMLAEDANLRKQIGQKAQQYALDELDLKKKEIELERIYDFVIENHKKKNS